MSEIRAEPHHSTGGQIEEAVRSEVEILERIEVLVLAGFGGTVRMSR